MARLERLEKGWLPLGAVNYTWAGGVEEMATRPLVPNCPINSPPRRSFTMNSWPHPLRRIIMRSYHLFSSQLSALFVTLHYCALLVKERLNFAEVRPKCLVSVGDYGPFWLVVISGYDVWLLTRPTCHLLPLTQSARLHWPPKCSDGLAVIRASIFTVMEIPLIPTTLYYSTSPSQPAFRLLENVNTCICTVCLNVLLSTCCLNLGLRLPPALAIPIFSPNNRGSSSRRPFSYGVSVALYQLVFLKRAAQSTLDFVARISSAVWPL